MLAGQHRRDLINERARTAIRDAMSRVLLRDINDMWQDEGFPPLLQDPEPVSDRGQRVACFQGYLNQVDWTHPGQVARALKVFEAALSAAFDGIDTQYLTTETTRIAKLLARDGYQLTDHFEIVGGPHVVVADEVLSNLDDPHVIRDHLARIQRAVVQDDPAQAIGSAKELIESTAKLVLRQRRLPVEGNEKLPALVQRAQTALAIHPSTATPGPDGSNSVKKILGSSSTIAVGIAELRNGGYGTGHGSDQSRDGLGTRHARLAINAAKLWCEFLLDTFGDPDAPWQRTGSSAGTIAARTTPEVNADDFEN